MTSAWLTRDEFIAASGYSRPTFFRRRAAGEIDSRTIDGVLKFSAASLTPEQRLKLGKERVELAGTPHPAISAPTLSPLSAQDQKPRVALTPEAKKLAEARLAVIRPLLDFLEAPASRPSFAVLKLADGRAVTTSDLMARYLAESRPCEGKRVSRTTIWNWRTAYAEHGLMGLARGVREDKGRSRWFAQHPKAAQLVASVWLAPFQTAQTAYDALLRECRILNLEPRDLPSYTTVRAYLEREIPKPIAVLAREGERAHSERMSLYLKRGYADVAPNQIWVSDHCIHDVFVWNDVFHNERKLAIGDRMRLQLTMILDMRSRRPVGYSWVPNGSSGSIKTALRRAVTAYGPCEQFYCDNGKDFQKVARGSSLLGVGEQEAEVLGVDIDEIERTGILTRLGIPAQHCIKFHPQSKHIERFFRTLHLQFDSKFAAYTTGSAYTRTDSANLLAFEHKRLQKLGTHGSSPLIAASVFIQMGAMWLEEVYSHHAHRGEGMDGLSPAQVFDAGYPIEARRTVDLSRVEELFWERKAVRVRETAVTLHKRRYMAIDAVSSNHLYLANESQVFIHYDPNDLDRAVVTNLDGHKIASVQAERLVPQSADAAPAIAASLQERRHHRNGSMEAIRGLRRSVHAMGHQPDLQPFYDRASLPAAVGDYITQRPPQTAHADAGDLHKTLHSDDIGDDIVSRLRRTADGTLG